MARVRADVATTIPGSKDPAIARHRSRTRSTTTAGVVLLDTAAMRRLQGSVGNRATTNLRARDRRGADLGVQRTKENVTYAPGLSAGDHQLATAFFDAYVVAVDNAYNYAVSVPGLGPLANHDGHTAHWATLWANFLNGQRPSLMAAAFGYVVESLATTCPQFVPAPPAGCSVDLQVTVGGTRPDLVLRLKRGTDHIAWVDLTASNSVDHIFSKDNWDVRIGTYAEVSYPSLTPGDIGFMRQNRANQGPLSQAQVERARRAAAREHQRNKDVWTQRGAAHYAWSDHRGAVKKWSPTPIELDDSPKREYIRLMLERDFQCPGLAEQQVPSILAAMGVNAAPWGYRMGYSQSERAGESWLVDNDPSWRWRG